MLEACEYWSARVPTPGSRRPGWSFCEPSVRWQHGSKTDLPSPDSVQHNFPPFSRNVDYGIITNTRYVAMSKLMATRWVGQNYGPIFCRLWTKVNRMKFAGAGVSVVCNAVFRLTMSCCVREIFVIKSLSGPKLHQNFDVLRPANCGWKGTPKSLTDFYKPESPLNLWQSLVMISKVTSYIRRQKKKKH